MSAPFQLLVRNSRAVLTADGPDGGSAEAMLGAIPGGAVGVRDGRVAWVGPEAALPPGSTDGQTELLDAGGGLVVPGFVDAHTHLLWAGDRSQEFALRCAGADYLAVARAGGGIASTVRAVRATSEEELVSLALPRLQRLLSEGVTTAEVKSGYGLERESELRMLRAIRTLGARQPIRLLPTFLWPHALLSEWAHDRAGFLAEGRAVLREVAREGLARFADAFIEREAFTAEEVRPLLEEARALGLGLKLHVDQLTAGRGAQFAAELGVLSADHLECVSSEGILALAGSGVTAVLVPTSTLVLRRPHYAPGRAMVREGIATAVATNVNPGSAPTESLSLSLALACLQNGLTPEEALLGVTRWGGGALGDETLGRLRVGNPADLLVLGTAEVAHLVSHLGVSHVRAVVCGGRIALRSESAARC
jgi:imidazolonepropionase